MRRASRRVNHAAMHPNTTAYETKRNGSCHQVFARLVGGFPVASKYGSTSAPARRLAADARQKLFFRSASADGGGEGSATARNGTQRDGARETPTAPRT